MENNLIIEVPDIEKSDSMTKRINLLMTSEDMKNDITLVWQGRARVADIVIYPDSPDNEEKTNTEERRNKIMKDTELLLKDLGLYFIRKPNDYAEGFGIEEFIISKDPNDIESFKKNKEIVYAESNNDTSKEQSIIADLLEKKDYHQDIHKAA